MSENREEILANFQSITAIDDVSEAILHLEECSWDLLTAVNRVMSSDNHPMVSDSPSVHMPTSSIAGFSMENLNNLDITTPSSPMRSQHGSSSVIRNILAGPSIPSSSSLLDDTIMMPVEDIGPTYLTSNNKKRDVKFNIHAINRIINVVMSDSCTIGDLKNRIKDELLIPVCRQVLTGWKSKDKRLLQNNNTQLKTLNVARENELYLNDLSEEGFLGDENISIENMDKTFTLNILYKAEVRTLKFYGTDKVLDVKIGIDAITEIPVRDQIWNGWPEGVTDSTLLYQTGINIEHSFSLRKKEGANSNIIEIEDDDASAEYESAVESDEDSFEMSVTQPARPIMLIPDQTDDETTKSLQFSENYIEKYGHTHPVFFQGSLEEAVNEACHKPAVDRKLLAIYLHYDKSVFTNVFCAQLLNDLSIIDYLLNNFILFGWDLTFENNKNMLLQTISTCIGESAALTVRSIPDNDKLPAIMVIVKTRSSFDVQPLIYGNVTVSELLSQLVEYKLLYSETITQEIHHEKERAEREKVKQEQDAAYKESLEADRAKEEARAQHELKKATERERAEYERATIEANREAKRKAAEMFVPPEPRTPTGDGISLVKFRTPKGEFMRSFTLDTTLKGLLSFIATKDYPIDEYKVLFDFPKRDLTERNDNETLKSLGFSNKVMVIVEERFDIRKF